VPMHTLHYPAASDTSSGEETGIGEEPRPGPMPLSHLAACLPCTTTTLAVGFEWYLVGKEGRKQGSTREREREAWGAGWKQGGEGGEGAWRHEGMEA